MTQDKLLSVLPGLRRTLQRKIWNQNVRQKPVALFMEELTSEGADMMCPELEKGALYVVHA